MGTLWRRNVEKIALIGDAALLDGRRRFIGA